MPQPLSSKENSLFRQLVKNYETKQYKKGIKAADQILRKTPNHGDTQAMKALILNSQGQTEEAFALAKVALKNDVKSHICWHVYGILYRSAKNYDESIKAYKFALRLEPESLQIQRDLANLQVQTRDYQGYIASRTTMLKARPQLRQNWTALAVAHHLAGDLEEAEKTLTMYEDTLKNPPPRTDIEHSEASIYKNTIIAEKGDFQGALDHLEKIMKTNADRTAVMELRAQYLLQLDRKADAEKAYRALLERNSEYRIYYEGLEKSLGLDRSSPESIDKLAELYESLAAKSERIDAPRRIPLDFLTGDKFRKAADSYLRRMLNKGVPSTFANIKALYQDPEKLTTIQDLVLGYASEKQANGSTDGEAGSKTSVFEEALVFFLAQHYNYHLSRDLTKATEYNDRAIELNPKFVDYTMTKARIWKHHGNTEKAAEVMEEARQLDEKDRYINTKCAKYYLRNNDNEKAIKTMSKFTRNEAVGGPLGDLHDMQCMWYITEDGEAHRRQGKFGLALKRFKAIYDIFGVWEEDQLDFHTFSFRKGQIRAYVDMIKWEDHLREHPFYTRAAISAAKIYITLHDKPQLGKDIEKNGSPDVKKEVKKAKAEGAEVVKKNATKPTVVGFDGEVKKEDTDPMGLKLVQTAQPLEEAMKFIGPLLKCSPKSIEAQHIGFEVFLRKEKHLLALQCLIAASKLDAENPTVHEQTVRFRKALDSLPNPIPDKVTEVINSTFTLIPKSTSLSDFNNAYLAKHSQTSASHVQAALQVRQSLDASTKAGNEKDLQKTLDLPAVTLDEAIRGRDLLVQWGSGEDTVKAYSEAAKKRWSQTSLI